MKTKKSDCPVCLENEVDIHPVYGVLPCESCQQEADTVGINEKHEYTSSSIKNGRIERQASHYQPYYNGVLSKEFIERHGTSKLAGVTQKDIKNAKYVYKHIPRWHKRNESKL